jgi:hypothetical protein
MSTLGERGSESQETRIPQPADLIVMAIGWGFLTLALVAGAKVLWDILFEGAEKTIVSELLAKIVVLSLAFIFGWVVSLVSIRALHNLILPLVIRLYALFIALGIAAAYLRVASKLISDNKFDPNVHYLRYSLVLTGLFFVLAGLHLLIENHDARLFSLPILLAVLFHLVVIVVHYVFVPDSNPRSPIAGIVGDLYFFLLVLIQVVLIATNLPFVNSLQRVIDEIFPPNSVNA